MGRWVAGPSDGALQKATKAAVQQRGALAKLDAALAAARVAPCRILGAGSSSMQGINATSAEYRFFNRIVRNLQALYPSSMGFEDDIFDSLEANWGSPSTAPGVRGYNAGHGGTTSADYMPAGEITTNVALNPAAVFHLATANDYAVGTSPATVKANIQSVIAAMKAATGPCVHILIHSYQRMDVASPTVAWSEYGRILREIAEADPDNVVYVDLAAAYEKVGIPGSDPLDLVSTDNVHSTDAGYRFMADQVLRLLGYPKRPAVQKLQLSDPFDRADGSLGQADTGQTWVTLGGTWVVASGKASVTSGGTVHINAGSADVDITCTITSGSQTPGVVFRSSDDNNRLGVFFAAGSSTVDLIRKDGGVNTTVTSGTSPVPTASGRNFKVRVTAIGDRITVFVNDVSVLYHKLSTADQAKYSAFTFVGFRCASADAVVKWDDLKVFTTVA